MGCDINGEMNFLVGVLVWILFDMIRMLVYDGVMGFCKELIFDKYICENFGLWFFMDLIKFVDGLYGIGVGLFSDRIVLEFEISDGIYLLIWFVRWIFLINYKNDEDEFFMKNWCIVEGMFYKLKFWFEVFEVCFG